MPCTLAIARCLVEDFVQDVLPVARPGEGVSVTVDLGDCFENKAWARADVVHVNCATWSQETLGEENKKG